MMKVSVTNKSDQTVERLGYFFEPGQTIEVEIKHPSHLRLLDAARDLTAEEVQDKKPAPKKKK